jgi:hypothetical protein
MSEGPHLSIPKLLARDYRFVSERHRGILLERLTLSGRDATLGAIGKRHGMTREGARLIIRKTLSAVDERTRFSDPIRHRLAILSDRSPVPIPLLVREPWAEGLSPEGACLVAETYSSLRRMKADRLGECLMPTGRDVWSGVERRMADCAAEADPATPAGEVFDEALSGIGLTGSALHACRRALLRIHAGLDAVGLKFEYHRLDAFVDALLPPGCPPRTLEALLERQHASSPNRLRPSQLRQLLMERALHVGGNRFRSRRGAAVPDAFAADVTAHCHALVSEGVPGRRWTAVEMLASLSDAGILQARRDVPHGRPRLAVDELDAILAVDGILHRVLPGVWTDTASRKGETSPHAIFEEILEVEGAALSKGELTRRCAAVWGAAVLGQIAPRAGSRIVLLPAGMIGLWPRDVPLREIDVALLGRTARSLMARGEIRIADLLAEPPVRARDIDPRHARAALRCAHGITASSGGILRGPDTGPRPRPGGRSAILVETLGSSPVALTLKELVARAESAFGKPIDNSIAYKVLREHGMRHPTVPDAWTMRPQATPSGG